MTAATLYIEATEARKIFFKTRDPLDLAEWVLKAAAAWKAGASIALYDEALKVCDGWRHRPMLGD